MKRVNARCDIVVSPRAKGAKQYPAPRVAAAGLCRRVYDPMDLRPTFALLILLALLLIGMSCLRGRAPQTLAARGRAPRAKEGYLIYPYLDLDEPGERGSYYALSERA